MDIPAGLAECLETAHDYSTAQDGEVGPALLSDSDRFSCRVRKEFFRFLLPPRRCSINPRASQFAALNEELFGSNAGVVEYAARKNSRKFLSPADQAPNCWLLPAVLSYG